MMSGTLLYWCRNLLLGCLSCCVLVAVSPAWSADPRDPWENFNRRIFNFNDVLDRTVLKPVSKLYDKLVPRPIKTGVRNFLRNIKTPLYAVNAAAQLNVTESFRYFSRFMINTTIGVVGLIDVAEKMGLPGPGNSFADTLAKWGVPLGPYLVVPILPPTSVRGATGLAADRILDPRYYWDSVDDRDLINGFSPLALGSLDARAQLLSGEAFLVGDRYTVLRDLYFLRNQTNPADPSEPSSGDDVDSLDDFGFDDEF